MVQHSTAQAYLLCLVRVYMIAMEGCVVCGGREDGGIVSALPVRYLRQRKRCSRLQSRSSNAIG